MTSPVPIGIGAFLFLRTSAQRQAMLPRCVELCGGSDKRVVAREVIMWSTVQPTEAGAFVWTVPDSMMSDCANAGVEVLMILSHPPTWAVGGNSNDNAWPCMPFLDIQTQGAQSAGVCYAAYCAAVAERYGPDGTFWQANPQLPYIPVQLFEIWNEPYLAATAARWNGTTVVPTTPNPVEYAAIFSLAKQAMAAVSSGKVMASLNIATDTGSPYAAPFLQAVTALPDALSVHPYPLNYRYASHSVGRSPDSDGTDWRRSWRDFDMVTDIRLVNNSLGLANMPIWVTEIGWPTQTTTSVNLGATQAAAESQQAARYKDLFEHLRKNERMVQGLIFYCYTNPWTPDQPGQDGYSATDPECFFGVYHTDGIGGAYDGATCTPKPAVAVITQQSAIGISTAE